MKLLSHPYLLIIILSFLNSASPCAQDYIVARTQTGLSLSGASCSKLLEQKEGLCAWKTQLNEMASLGNAACNSQTSLSLNSCLPDFVKSYHKKLLHKFGPNCWGTALYFKAMSKTPRFVYPEEMIYWLESPICRKLERNEIKAPGDIINVFAPEYKSTPADEEESDAGIEFWKALYPGRYRRTFPNPNGSNYTGYHTLFHSVTLASSELAFGKDSQLNEDRFYLHSLNETYGRPRTERECQENSNLSAHLREYQNSPRNIKGEKCAYFTNVYRCQNFEDYFSTNDLTNEQKAIYQEIKRMQEAQTLLFSYVTQKDYALPTAKRKEIQILGDAFSQKALEELRQKPEDKMSEMLLTLKYFSAEALKTSLKQSE